MNPRSCSIASCVCGICCHPWTSCRVASEGNRAAGTNIRRVLDRKLFFNDFADAFVSFWRSDCQVRSLGIAYDFFASSSQLGF